MEPEGRWSCLPAARRQPLARPGAAGSRQGSALVGSWSSWCLCPLLGAGPAVSLAQRARGRGQFELLRLRRALHLAALLSWGFRCALCGALGLSWCCLLWVLSAPLQGCVLGGLGVVVFFCPGSVSGVGSGLLVQVPVAVPLSCTGMGRGTTGRWWWLLVGPQLGPYKGPCCGGVCLRRCLGLLGARACPSDSLRSCAPAELCLCAL